MKGTYLPNCVKCGHEIFRSLRSTRLGEELLEKQGGILCRLPLRDSNCQCVRAQRVYVGACNAGSLLIRLQTKALDRSILHRGVGHYVKLMYVRPECCFQVPSLRSFRIQDFESSVGERKPRQWMCTPETKPAMPTVLRKVRGGPRCFRQTDVP